MKPAMVALAGAMLIASTSSGAQLKEPRHQLLDVVVFGAFLRADVSAYSPEVRSLLLQHIKRSESYRPRPRPEDSKEPVMGMVYAARESYERRLVASVNTAGVETLAQRYVDDLRPCYEWEGYHNCPEAEAKFAEQYLKQNPRTPFRELLTLLAAHRWLCAAEGYKYEEKPLDAALSARASEPHLARALKSRSLLIRTAAQELKARDGCQPASR